MPSHTQRLDGRVAFITGASSGLGAHLACAMSLAGARVVAGARRLDRLEALAEEVRLAGGELLPVHCDVEDEGSVVAAYDAAEAAFGTVDTIIANAGMNSAGPSLSLDAKSLAQLLAVNVGGVYLTAREGARRLIASANPDRGRIVLIGSVGSFKALAGLTAYSMSKAAVAMMGKGFAAEWARYGICVNTLCPGWIATDLNAEWLASEGGAKLVKTFPRRRVMQPADLDPQLMLLASDAGASISGGVFAVDEGQAL